MKIVDKKLQEVRILINGAGSAGIAICKLLLNAGAKNIVMCDINGSLVEGDENLNPAQKEIAKRTNREKEKGKLFDVIKGKDIFIGVSGPKILTKEMVATMAKDSIVFAMANPEPEILPDEAKAGGARVVATGRSDFPNQINNVLVFPGIFRGALDVKASEINEEMKIAAARGVANLIKEEDLNEEYIIPDPFNKEVAESVSKEVRRIAKEMNICK